MVHFCFHFENSSIVIGCSSTTFTAQLTTCLRDMARHFKTDHTETVAFCFGYQVLLILCQLARWRGYKRWIVSLTTLKFPQNNAVHLSKLRSQFGRLTWLYKQKKLHNSQHKTNLSRSLKGIETSFWGMIGVESPKLVLFLYDGDAHLQSLQLNWQRVFVTRRVISKQILLRQ
jgi:hypothetical protein